MRGEVDFATSLRSRVEGCGCADGGVRPRARASSPRRASRAHRGRSRARRAVGSSPAGSTRSSTRRSPSGRGRVAGEPARQRATDAERLVTARSWMPRARRRRCASGPPLGRAARAHDRDRRRRERPADDGGRRPRTRVQREARRPAQADLVVGPVDLRKSSRAALTARRPRRRDRYRRGMDIILVPGLWLDASSWDDITPTPRTRRPHGPRPDHARHRGTGEPNPRRSASPTGSTPWSTRSTRARGSSCSWATVAAAMSSTARPTPGPNASRGSCSSTPSPPGDGGSIWEFPIVDGVVPFPGWDFFEEQEVADLDESTRAAAAARAQVRSRRRSPPTRSACGTSGAGGCP